MTDPWTLALLGIAFVLNSWLASITAARDRRAAPLIAYCVAVVALGAAIFRGVLGLVT